MNAVSSSRSTLALRGSHFAARITAVELDPLVADVAQRCFGVAEGPGLENRVADARAFLERSPTGFDVIEADLFAGGVYPPLHAVTREFFTLVRSRLRPSGVTGVNVLAVGGDDRVARAVADTIAAVVPAVFKLPLRDQRILFGLCDPVDLVGVRARLEAAGVSELGDVIRAARRRLRPADGGPGEDRVLTDDRAPVEQLTNAMLADNPGLRGTAGE